MHTQRRKPCAHAGLRAELRQEIAQLPSYANGVQVPRQLPTRCAGHAQGAVPSASTE